MGIAKVGKFEKVSFEQFLSDFRKVSTLNIDEDEVRKIYDNIQLPKRATIGSAGYDFNIPYRVYLRSPNDSVVIPTGIRVKVDEGWHLKIYPRSGLGFKFGLSLYNTVGVIDSDYYHSDNEGHIMAKIKAISHDVELPAGKGFAQGIFEPYGITYDDEAYGTRNGGFGSTDKKSS